MQANVFISGYKWVTQFVFFLQRKHPLKLKQYNECVLKRKNSEEQRCDSAVKQMKIKDYSTSCRQVTQSTADRLVVEFVCDSLQPFTIVELPTFKNLIHTMQPSCTVMSRPTVKLRIEEAAAKIKKNITAEMAKVSYIGTTTDCWTARQRSYIGVTAHWIDESWWTHQCCDSSSEIQDVMDRQGPHHKSR